jgi:hypothetical protein
MGTDHGGKKENPTRETNGGIGNCRAKKRKEEKEEKKQ